MATADVQIIEFRGSVSGSGRDEVTTYLLILDGDYRRKYRKPSFEYFPKEWREKYQVRSFEVGAADSWKSFYALCTECLEAAEPLELTDSTPEASETGHEAENEKPEEPRELDSPADPVEPNREEVAGSKRVEGPPLPTKTLAVFEDLLEEPPERPLSLEYEISGYMAVVRNRAERLRAADLELAEAIAERTLNLLSYVADANTTADERMLVQAAVRYFTVADDASHDWQVGGFEDDAAVFNFICKRLGRPDLEIPIPYTSTG